MSFAKLFSEIMRDYVTAGVPSSGVQKPSKSDLRTWGAAVEAACTANPNIGLTFLWDTGVNDADPGTGKIRGNNSIVSLITQIFVSETGSAGDALAGFLQAMDDAASNTKGILVLRDLSNLANMAAFTVTGSITDGGTYDKITVANLTSSGTFASGATIGLAFFRIGDTTHSGLDYAFDTGTSDANPGSGLLRFNNATLGSATVMYINKTGRNGESLGTLIGTWDDASATHRGHGRVFDINDRTKYIEFDLNGSLTDATTYWKVPLSNVAGGTTPASGAILDVVFARAGDSGSAVTLSDDGATRGPTLPLERISASPAANDLLADIIWRGRDSGGNQTNYLSIVGRLLDPTDGSEDAELFVEAMIAGAVTEILKMGNGFQIGSPTGGYKGVGTVNLTEVYKNGVPSWTSVVKTSDESTNTDTTLNDDAALLFAMAANTKYAIRARVFFTTNDTADIKFRHTGPSSPTLVHLARRTWTGVNGVANQANDTAFSGSDIAVSASFTEGVLEIDGVVHNGANTGNFTIQWAQNTSNGGATIVRAGSYIEYRVVA